MEEEKVKHVGQILKDYRLKKKITIEKISNKTKISIQNLINIEEGNLHLIGGQFYQRSFIKSYVEALRISEKKILLLLDNVLHNSDEKVIFKKDLDLEANKRPIITEKIPLGIYFDNDIYFLFDKKGEIIDSIDLNNFSPKIELIMFKGNNSLANAKKYWRGVCRDYARR